MPRYFLQISYKGTAYHGWQRQINGISVQETLESALSQIGYNHQGITGCGRTDTGVHAQEFFAHFETDDIQDSPKFIFQMNSVLPYDIAVHKLIPVTDEAHARFDASARTYVYRIHHRKDPFLKDLSFLHHNPLDIELMNEGADFLIGRFEFTSFAKMHGPQKTDYCDVSMAEWTSDGQHTEFKIRADRYLRNMVRAIVGTLIEVGSGKIPTQRVKQILEQKDRSQAGTSAPAHGLYLNRIDYPYIQRHVS